MDHMRIILLITLLFAALGSGVWDVVAVAKGQPQNQISTTLLQWSRLYPILPLAIGVLLGHLFWPDCVIEYSK